MSDMLDYDEQTAREVEAVYTTPDVLAQRQAFRALVRPRAGERVIDIGSGPGFLAIELAAEVGAGGLVAGVDGSESMLALARRRTAPAGSAPVEFHPGDALRLPVPDADFDIAVSTQVYEYVEDVPAALAEARRVLRPGGRIAILDTDWDSLVWHTDQPGRMRRVLAAWDEHLADPYLPRRLPSLLRAAGFSDIEVTVIPLLNWGYHPNSFSAGLVPLIARFVAGRQGVSAAEAAAWAAELAGLGDRYFFSLNRYAVSASR